MTDVVENASETTKRRSEILAASLGVFVRFGFRKASLEEVARAAGISRQGLYLHFSSKDVLFRAAVELLLNSSLARAQAALTEAGTPIEARLLKAFEGLHGDYLDATFQTPHRIELMETSGRLVGDLVASQEAAFQRELAAAIEGSGVAEAWRATKLTATQLAQTLSTVANGVKHRAVPGASPSRSDYLEQVRAAICLVCQPQRSSS